MVADEVVETPYAVCKTAVLTVELIGNNKYTNHYSTRRKTRHISCVPELVDIKINFAVCVVNGWSEQTRTVECMRIRHVH